MKAKPEELRKSDFAGSGGAIKRGLRPQRKDAGAEAGRSGKALLTRPPLRGVGQQPGDWAGALPGLVPGGWRRDEKDLNAEGVKRGGENDLRQTEAGKTRPLASKRGAERPRGRLRSERAPGLPACRRANRKLPAHFVPNITHIIGTVVGRRARTPKGVVCRKRQTAKRCVTLGTKRLRAANNVR